MNIPRNARLGLGDGAAEVAAAYAELDRNVALRGLVIDEGCAGIDADGSELAQRNVGRRAARGLICDRNIGDLLDTVAIFWREADREIELPIALQHRGCHGARHCRLDNGVHVARVEPIPGGSDAIDLDVEIRLTDDVENSDILHALDALHLLRYPAGVLLQHLEIRTEHFH